MSDTEERVDGMDLSQPDDTLGSDDRMSDEAKGRIAELIHRRRESGDEDDEDQGSGDSDERHSDSD